MTAIYDFSNKLVLVTGSTLGIGKGIAEEFLKAGAKVIVNGREQKTVDKVVDEMKKLLKSGQDAKTFVIGIAADVSTKDGAKSLCDQVDKIGQLDILVNNVGIFAVKDFAETSDEDWLNFFNVNVMSAVRLSRHFLPQMLKRPKSPSRILMLASEAGMRPIPTMIHYSTTKTAMIGLSRGLAELTKSTAITVNSVLAGPTWTEGLVPYLLGWNESRKKKDPTLANREWTLDDITADYFAKNETTSLLQRYLTVKEVADTCLFLASGQASGINGHAQRVEGGIIRAI